MDAAAQTFVYPISDLSGAGAVRRAAVTMGKSNGLTETEQSNLAIIAAEASKNLATHAKRGEIHLRALQFNNRSGVELLSIDKGPGMADIARCMADGYSTAGTAGIGLGAISRLSTSFDIYSDKAGTVLMSQVWTRPTGSQTMEHPWTWGVVQNPQSGETVCGDAFAFDLIDHRFRALVADGLGHGAMARQAACEAVRLFRSNPHHNLVHVMELLHAGLRPTRGAAVSTMEYDEQSREIHFVGVGNVSAVIAAHEKNHSLTPMNGTVGHAVRKVQQFTYSVPPNCVLVMFSDGLASHWRLDGYPGLLSRHPAIIAAVLFRDFNRGRDDVTVMVIRQGQTGRARQ